jgi:hypothetical protein
MEHTLDLRTDWKDAGLPQEVTDCIVKAPSCIFPLNREELFEAAMCFKNDPVYEVAYDFEGTGRTVEATVTRCRNGVAINYPDPYMRRRDPECMFIGDVKRTDKPRFQDRFGKSFASVREESLEWLSSQPLLVLPFSAGGLSGERRHDGILVTPANAAFFAAALGDLQEAIPADRIPSDFNPDLVMYLVPPFRHTHFDGKQIVVHNRHDAVYEIFSYNLYPGPSAKKGVYGALLNWGVKDQWPTLHASAAQLVTPYDNVVTILHEGASGSGKSELLEHSHRQPEGQLLLGENTVTGERVDIALGRECEIRRICDDMAVCPAVQDHDSGWLVIEDAEAGWFIRTDHIKQYGIDPNLESWTVHPREPLIFFNMEGVPDATCLIWEHKEDSPGVPCPNPRVIMPRKQIPDTVNHSAEVHYRNFGVRTPPCTKEQPSYGIIGYLHLLPPALAWLWRLAAPRGHANPSILSEEALSSEGVGSFWPFATGLRIDHANLLLDQMLKTPLVRYTLTPNQYVGAWRVSFMPQWIARDYLARRGLAAYGPNMLRPARSPLLGYTLNRLRIEGMRIPGYLLRVEEQPEVECETYDIGAKQLHEFFEKEIKLYLGNEMCELGKEIITCCLDNGTLDQYESLLSFD